MSAVTPLAAGRRLRVRGIVQGVGFRPGTLKLAREFAIVGSVRNEGTAVVIEAFGDNERLQAFESAVAALRRGGARVDALDSEAIAPVAPMPEAFEIAHSAQAQPGMGVAPDWATCPACVAEMLDPFARRYRYPFAACTDCGPRLSVFQHTPYDRANTTLADFPLCADCATEYTNADDRRFHAQPIACHVCGPRAWLKRLDGRAFALDAMTALDDVDAATSCSCDKGEIVAIKGLGGFQLACDATNQDGRRALARTQTAAAQAARADGARSRRRARLVRHRREAAKPHCTDAARRSCCCRGVPMAGAGRGIAPGSATLGVMLPNTPLHHLMMRRSARPIVLTSGNLSRRAAMHRQRGGASSARRHRRLLPDARPRHRAPGR